jgi:HSP20 family protein
MMEKRRRDMGRAAEEIEQLFADLWEVFPFSRGIRRSYRPDVDVYRTEDPPSLTVVAELPGVDPGEVKVVASAKGLLIAGERQRPKNYGQYQQLEIEYGPFQRHVTLAADVDPELATATYERGFLTIKLPIAPEPAPTERISIVVTSS